MTLKSRLLKLYLGFFGSFFVLFIFMTISGTFVGIEFTSWFWFFTNLAPILLILFFVELSQSFNFTEFNRLLSVLVISYLLTLLITFLGSRFWLDRFGLFDKEGTLEKYFLLTYLWLLPIQALLFVLIGMMIALDKWLRRINAPNQGLIQNERIKAVEGDKVNQQIALDLVAKGKLPDALKHLKLAVQEESLENDLINLSARHEEFKKMKLNNTENFENISIEFNRIVTALVELARKI